MVKKKRASKKKVDPTLMALKSMIPIFANVLALLGKWLEKELEDKPKAKKRR